MDRNNKIDLILSTLRNEPQTNDLTFTISGHLLLEDGTTQQTGDIAVITWLFRGGRFAGMQTLCPTAAVDGDVNECNT